VIDNLVTHFINIITFVVTPTHHWQSTGLTKTNERNKKPSYY